MDSGNDTCYMMGVGHSRLVPLGEDGKWQTYNNGKWIFIPGVQSFPLTPQELNDARKKMYAKSQRFGLPTTFCDDDDDDDDDFDPANSSRS